jgi:alginate O-acetyltransferase complex protein AlgI
VLFHTLHYLVFLLLVVTLYWGVHRKGRLWVLGLSSVGFYVLASMAKIEAAVSWQYLPIIVSVAFVAWFGASWLFSPRSGGKRQGLRQTLVVLLVLSPLLFFKYWNFIAENVEWIMGRWGQIAMLPRVELALPVGISFFTFQAVAYVIDVARARESLDEDLAPEQNPGRFWTFLAFFPQLIAGPIVRRHELLPQLKKMGMLTENQVGAGVYRILRGCLKKAVIADPLMIGIVNPVFLDPGSFLGIEVLVALYAFTLAIYCDFSGYTDIAIGSARLFGIELPENFNRPYKATSVAGFWRRWHITLSNWVRDYIYYPLGGSRGDKEWRVYFNIMVTMLIIALWHRANWNYVIYGLLHGTMVGVNRWQRKRTGRRPGDPMPNAWGWTWRWLLTFHFIVFARILFQSSTLEQAQSIVLRMEEMALIMPRFSPTSLAILVGGYALHFTPTGLSSGSESWFKKQNPVIWAFFAAGVGATCMLMASGDSLAFVYYQF